MGSPTEMETQNLRSNSHTTLEYLGFFPNLLDFCDLIFLVYKMEIILKK